MPDQPNPVLVDALKQALAEPGEQRLLRSGKLTGLFASRAGAAGQAAAEAVRDGLLEVVRTDVKGKTAVEWVRITPRGVDYLHERESPRQALEDLHAVLQANRAGLPLWLADLQGRVELLSKQLTEDVGRWAHRLDALTQQVEQALHRLNGDDAADGAVPWSKDALGYLDRRTSGGAPGDCPLPELFAALRDGHPELSVTAFHDGLRRLRDRRTLRLLPFTGPLADLSEPEFALPEGTATLYYVRK
jgi:hypothetical protein